jgi:hypothetical protein
MLQSPQVLPPPVVTRARRQPPAGGYDGSKCGDQWQPALVDDETGTKDGSELRDVIASHREHTLRFGKYSLAANEGHFKRASDAKEHRHARYFLRSSVDLMYWHVLY